jgi:alpha-galactosidase
MAPTGDGSYYVALYNLNGAPANVSVRWSDLGFSSAISVRDVWNRINLGPSIGTFQTTILGHGSRILKVKPAGHVTPRAGQSYEAESAVLNGAAVVSQCAACSSGAKVSFIGASATTNTVTFNSVDVATAGTYRMQVDALTQGPRALVYSINGGPQATLNLSGGSFNLPQSTTVPVTLTAGVNTITFSNPGTFAADLDRIVINGDGHDPAPTFTTYEAEAAQLSGTASIGGCSFCSGGAYVGNFGAGTQNAVTFPNVSVPRAGMYQLDVEYTTSGLRSFYVSINGGTPIELDLNGSTFDSPVPAVIPVQLQAGANQIVFTNPNPQGYTPGLDSITISPMTGTSSLSAALTHKAGPDFLRTWRFTVSNNGAVTAQQATLNSFTLVPVDGEHGCKAVPVLPLPLPLGSIPAGATSNINVPIAFTPWCTTSTTFTLHAIFSANNGADVSTLTTTQVR